MVNTDNDSGLQRSFAPFAERLGATGGADRFAVLKYFNLSPRLYNALESQVSKKANFNRKIASRSNAAIGDGHRASVRPHQVPQLIFLHQFEQVRAFFPHIAEHQARRFCAMAVLKLTGGTWRDVANFLGLPGSMIRMANKLIVLLNAAGNTDSFRDHLFVWAKDLGSTTTGIDFSGRRDAMRDFVDIPDKHWQEMCAAAGIHPGLRGGRSRHAAAWVWAEITQGDWRLAPSLADEALGKYQHDLYQTFAKKQLPILQPLLSIYAKAAITDAETHATQATRPAA